MPFASNLIPNDSTQLNELYARYLCSRDALGLNAACRPSAARDDRVSCIQLNETFPTVYNMLGFETKNVHPKVDVFSINTNGTESFV